MIYFLCVFITSVFAWLAQKMNNRIFVFMAALVLSVYCGLRNPSVGRDTPSYLLYFYNLKIIGVEFGSDIGFSVISYYLLDILDNEHLVLLFFAFVTQFLIIFRLWDFREKASLLVMLLIYTIFYYPYTFNIMRQFLAIAIIFWGTRYIENNKLWMYVLLNLIAATIHTSALICFGILFINENVRNELTKRKYIYYFLAICLIGLGINIFRDNIHKYINYFQNLNFVFHAMLMLKLFLILIVMFFNKPYKNNCFSVNRFGNIVSLSASTINLYLLGIILACLGMFFTYMNRIGFYFLMFELPFWGQVIYARNNRIVFRVLTGLMIFYVLWSNIVNNTSGIIEYSTFI